MQTSLSELELRLYWRCRTALGQSDRTRAASAERADILDDLDLLAEQTTWPRLRTLCLAAIMAAQPLQALAASIL